MLPVLKFKKSLFAEMLDGGEREPFLGGSRLSRFIDTVEKATASTEAQPDRRRSQSFLTTRSAHTGLATKSRRSPSTWLGAQADEEPHFPFPVKYA